MRRRRSAKAPQPLGDILYAALKRRGLAEGLEVHTLRKLWPVAVGPRIAAQTRPDSLRSGRLFVRVTSSVWVQQLHFLKEEILEKFNTLAGNKAIREIIFTIGHVPTAAGVGAQMPNLPELNQRDKKMIEDSTKSLADRELAEILRRVMEKEIRRRRRLEARQAR